MAGPPHGPVILQRRPRGWECPNCDQTHVTYRADVHTPFHPCPGAGMLSVPYVAAGTRAKVARVEREDYVDGDTVTLDADRRPIMAVVITRDDGEDRTVFAPLATAGKD